MNVSREDGEKGKKKVTILEGDSAAAFGGNISSGTYGRVDEEETKVNPDGMGRF